MKNIKYGCIEISSTNTHWSCEALQCFKPLMVARTRKYKTWGKINSFA
jgi:hypothetical protein